MSKPKRALNQKSKTDKIILTPQEKKIKSLERQYKKVMDQYIRERQDKWAVEATLNKTQLENRYMKRSLIQVVKETAGVVKSLLEDVESNLCPEQKISDELQLNRLMEVLTSIAHSSKNDLLQSNNINEFLNNCN